MNKILLVLLLIIISYPLNSQHKIDLDKYKPIAEKIIAEAYRDSSSWQRLAYLCDVFGPRLSGSDNLENAIDWVVAEMKKDGLANVTTEKVMVPNWKRGNEYARLVEPRDADIYMFGLGGTIGTPPEGITAEVLIVRDKDELEKRSEEARGKIVLFNHPWEGYGRTVQYRFYGAQWAARHGAVASLIRSVTPKELRNVHTGMMAYNDTIPKIPHAAISPEDAALLQRLSGYGITPKIKLYMEAKTLPDAESRNLYGELTGRELPQEYIAAGGHLDSWDAGTGAQDDASGCVSVWEALNLLKDLNIIPRRTIRSVMWTNEENGVRGGKAYAEMHGHTKHVLMFEQDGGVFKPSAIRFTGPDSLFAIMQQIEPLLKMVEEEMKVSTGGGGVDIRPMMELGIPGSSISTDDEGRYFWYHHSNSDTVDKVDPHEFNRNIAAIAIALYIYADLPIELPHFNPQQGTR